MARPVRSAEIAELRAFCAAVDLGSLGRAARLLRVSQPALSKRLRALEAVAGARLLERSPRGVRPTPAGNRLYTEARKLLAQAETVDDLMAGLSDDQMPIRLAASHTIAEFVLPGPLVEFERRHERHLSVELVIANSEVVRELVSDGRAEFGIAALERDAVPPGLQAIDYCEDEVVVAVPEEHAWASRREVALADFLSTPMVMRDPSANTRRIVESALRERGLELAPPLAEVGSTTALRETALSEAAPALLSGLAVRDWGPLTACRVRGLRFPRRFVFLLGGEESLTASARALLTHLQAHKP
jgi:DNA-binding transcriptional LysR family regulator